MKAVTFIAALALVFSCFGGDLELVDGRVLVDYSILDSDPTCIIVAHTDGIESVPFENCPLDIQAIYKFDPKEAARVRDLRAKEKESEDPVGVAPELDESELLAALAIYKRDLEAAAKIAEQEEKLNPYKEPFGVRIGVRFDGTAFPFRKESSVEYHHLDSVPQPHPFFSKYSLLVSESSRRIVGIEASQLKGASFEKALSALTAELNEVYGRGFSSTVLYDFRRHRVFYWQDGQMGIKLETHRGLELTYQIPN